MEVRSVEIAGARCWIYGPRGARPRVVFLHGLRGDHHGLEPIVRHLDNLPTLVPDLPGFGVSPPMHDPHDVIGYAAWTRRFLDIVAPGRDVVLVGHSFGSVVAAAVAADDPSLAGLILVAPIAEPPSADAIATRLARWFHAIATALPERAGTGLLRHRLVSAVASRNMVTTRDPSLRRWIHREHRRRFGTFADRAVLLEAFGSSLRDAVGAYAGGIRVPTLIIAGERDGIAPLGTQRELLLAFADAELSVLSGTGHLLHYERPDAAAIAIRSFLDRRGLLPDAGAR